MTMLLTAGPLAVRGSRLNPVTKLVALVVLALPVLITGNVVVAGILIAGEIVALAVAGLGVRVLIRYAWPFLLAMVGVAAANYLASGNLDAVVPVVVRLLALALPGLLFVLTTEPVDLADSLVQLWRMPARFAYGALAAFRLMPLLGADLVAMRRARRARGLAVGANPLRAIAVAGGLLFGILVAAIRRGTRLAAAMDARGFSAGAPRTFARIARLRRVDRVVMALAVALAVLATVAGLLAGG
jgi:energy-coupling factor transport system permease protein